MNESRIKKRVIISFIAICFAFSIAFSEGAAQVKADNRIRYLTETDILTDVWVCFVYKDIATDFDNPISNVKVNNVLLDNTQYKYVYTDSRPSGTITQKWTLYLTASYLSSLERNKEYHITFADSSGYLTGDQLDLAFIITTNSTSEPACEHEYDWIEEEAATTDKDALLVYKCKKCGHIDMRMDKANSAYLKFNQDTEKKINDASYRATVKINTIRWNSFYRSVIDKLTLRKDVTLVIEYTDAGQRRQITIPAETDLAGFIDENGYTGFEYLISRGYETDYWESRLAK